MSLAVPEFDQRSLFHLRCTPAQVGGVFATLEQLEGRIEARRARWWARTWMGLGVIVAALVTALVAGAPYAQTVGGLAYLGALYAVGAFLVYRLVVPEGMPRFLSLVFLGGLGIFAIAGPVESGHLFMGLDPRRSPPAFAAGLLLSAAVVVWGLRLLLRPGVAALSFRPVELGYVKEIVGKLAADLSPGARCEIVCCPFKSSASRVEVASPVQRPGYTYEASAGLLLDLQIALDATHKVRLSMVEFSVDKIKDRKSKYKGTKRSILYRYAISPAKADAPTMQRELDGKLAGLKRQAASAELGLGQYATPKDDTLSSDVKVGPDKVGVVQLFKNGVALKELERGDLLPPAFVLETLRVLSTHAL